MRKIIISPLAEQDLTQIWEYIAIEQFSIQNADKLVTAFDEKFKLLAKSPNIGANRPELGENLRSFPVNHHLIFYRSTKDYIEIIRVLNGSRYLEDLF